MQLKKYLGITIITLISLVLHFAFLRYPSQIVFDELYFGKFSSNYVTGQYFFDVHPPTGKLLMSAALKLSGAPTEFSFERVGQAGNGATFFALRFMPALAGAFIPLLIYLILINLGISKRYAFLGAFLSLFDNALLVESRLILVDIFLLFFGLASLYFLTIYNKAKTTKKRWLFLIMTLITASLAVTCKWTGLTFLAIAVLYFLVNLFAPFNWKTALVTLAILVGIPFLTYYGIFMIHAHLIVNPTPGNSLWQHFIQLQKDMYYYHTHLTDKHPYSSHWYQWPLGQKPIWYWVSYSATSIANIWLLPNMVVWLIALLGAFMALCTIAIKKVRQRLPLIVYLMLFGYVISLLPFIFVGRVVFVYMYLPSLVLGILMFAIVCDHIHWPWPRLEKIAYSLLLGLCLLFFIIFTPLTYGIPIPKDGSLQHFYHFFASPISYGRG